jgi:hypothetical protein
MQDHNIDPMVAYENLITAFFLLGLDPEELIQFNPQKIEYKNRMLADLLRFTKKYLNHKNRQVMELTGDPFPPIFPFFSPESDWFRFERWIRGESVRVTIRELLPDSLQIKPSEQLSDEELTDAINELTTAMASKGFYINLKDIPDRLYYEYILDCIEEEHDHCPDDGWHFDGCSGYCPGCVQRPWCDTGLERVWPEDEDAGMMALPEELKDYVSASPVSLEVLLRDDFKSNDSFWIDDRPDKIIWDN